MFGMKGLCSGKLAFFKGHFLGGREKSSSVLIISVGTTPPPPRMGSGLVRDPQTSTWVEPTALVWGGCWVKPQGRLLPENYLAKTKWGEKL